MGAFVAASLASALLAHGGRPLLPHDAWAAWAFDLPIVAGVLLTAWSYWRGWRLAQDGTRHGAAMLGGLLAIVVALLSPIDAVGGILLTAHMVQHVLLTAIAAPLIAWAAPGAALLRGLPVAVRRRFVSARRSTGLDAAAIDRLRQPAARWMLFVAVLWLWHSSVLYSSAIENDLVHAIEHVSFLGAGLAFWTVILGPARVRVSPGFAILAVFTLTLQGIVLSMLMTFSQLVWYEPYRDAAIGWGLDPLEDQQLAGVIMWIPTGFIHTGITLALVVGWFRSIDHPEPDGRSGRSVVARPIGSRGLPGPS